MGHRLHLPRFFHNLLHPSERKPQGVTVGRAIQPTGSRLNEENQSRRSFLKLTGKAAGATALGIIAKKGWDWHRANVMERKQWVTGCSTFLRDNAVKNNAAWAEYYYNAFKGKKNPTPLKFETMAEINKFAELIARSEKRAVSPEYIERALETIKGNYKAIYFTRISDKSPLFFSKPQLKYDPSGPGYARFMKNFESASRGRSEGKQTTRNYNVLDIMESFHRLPQGMREEVARFVGY